MACPTILIIDDDPANGWLLEHCLTKEGFATLLAGSGSEGRDLARARQPNLILLDRSMPGEDGLQTCAGLKADARTAEIPIIFVSSDDDISVKVTAFEAGAVDYITKPFARAEVLARVRLHLRLHQARQDAIEGQAFRLRQLAAAQRAMLVQPEQAPEARFSVYWAPVQEAGGDFYDVIPISDGIWDYLIADVAGHDLPSSLVTAALKALVRQNASPISSPAETIQTINAVMHRVYPDGPYITLAYARLNRLRHNLTVVLAGHPPVLRVQAPGRSQILGGPSDLIGPFEPLALHVESIPVRAGDRLHFYTDGLIEAGEQGAVSRRGGLTRLTTLCANRHDHPLAAVADEIVRGVFPSPDQAADDLLLLTVEV